MSKILAVDVGGTNIKIGTVINDGAIIRKSEYITHIKGVSLINRLINIIRQELLPGTDGIAISSAGQIDSETGFVIEAVGDSFKGYKGLNIVKILNNEFNLPVSIDNDANCAAIAEGFCGAAVKYTDYIMVTLGTGIGGAIVSNNILLKGSRSIAGEIGHMSIDRKGEICSCGNTGCYELYGSTTALLRMIKDELNIETDINGKYVFDLIRDRDERALRVFDKWIENISIGLTNLIHIFNPQAIIIGGGISEQGRILIEAIERKIKNKAMMSFTKNLAIVKAELNNDAALIGATKLFRDKFKNEN